MNATIESYTKADTTYHLTINNQTGQATNCTCPDCFYRNRACKHIKEYNATHQEIHVCGGCHSVRGEGRGDRCSHNYCFWNSFWTVSVRGY